MILQEGSGIKELLDSAPGETILGLLLLTIVSQYLYTTKALIASFERREKALLEEFAKLRDAIVKLVEEDK